MLKQIKLTVTLGLCAGTLLASAATAPKASVQKQIETYQKNYTIAMQKGDVVQASKEAQKISHLRMGASQPTTLKVARR